MENIVKVHNEILKVLNKYKDVCIFNIKDLEARWELYSFGLELKEKHGLNIDPKKLDNINYTRLSDYKTIIRFTKGDNRRISWSDDGKQPSDELLFELSFPTGAYIFGNDYPTELFQKFFDELKSYSPKYTDTTNKCLYFSIKTSKEIFNNFDSVLEKYYELNKEDYKFRQIKKMEADIEKLKIS